MNFTIDRNGLLHITRRGTTFNAMCPFHPHGGRCGIWCPLFGEPEFPSPDHVTLDLCRKTLRCKAQDFHDYRDQPKEEQPCPR
jgi:hypothetical protein